MFMKKKPRENLASILDLLNQGLQLEYSLIVHYPRLASAIKDEETRKLALKLGSDSIRHADIVAGVISGLGENPLWSFEAFPEETNLVKVFQVQLEKEKLALQLHRQSSDLVLDSSLRDRFRNMAKEEEQHIQIAETILSRLTQDRGSS